jgi:hypothetical protein
MTWFPQWYEVLLIASVIAFGYFFLKMPYSRKQFCRQCGVCYKEIATNHIPKELEGLCVVCSREEELKILKRKLGIIQEKV